MRKTLIALLLACSLPALSQAAPDDMPQGPGGHGGRMFKELNLNREQQKQMRDVMREQMQGRHAIVQRYLDKLPASERQAMDKELADWRSKTDSEIEAILTPEQQKTFAQLREKMKAMHGDMPPPAE